MMKVDLSKSAKAAIEQIRSDVQQVVDNGFEEMLQVEADAAAAQDEIDDVLTFLRRHEVASLLGIEPPTLAQIIRALEDGEHRR